MEELFLNKCMEKAQTKSNLSITNTNNDMNIKFSKEFLTKLQNNEYHRTIDEDVVDHIAKVLEILDLINVPGMDSHQLRMKVFPLLLADDAREWWINEGEGKITTWEELVEKYFLNSSFENNKKVDGRTKKVLFHSWLNGSWNKRCMDDDILSSDDTTTDSFFKPYLKTQEKNNTGKDNERRQMKRKCIDANLEANNTSNTLNNERPNKRMCNDERFEVIKYSLGPNKEYIAIIRCEYDTWERNDDTIYQIYQEIFQKKDNGWKVTRTK
ncbi:hypothetical protein Tco_0753203 [Tanacetum coccineum]